ncbi:MAG: hypothetical protein EOO73_07770 [Myxococcales bacterium]|nr:MAG: hypothetical protein EOO73_07770 [Myxococcales bacterium]
MNEAPDPALRIVQTDYDHAKGVAYNLVLLVWRRRTMPDAYRAAMVLATEHARKHPKGIGVMQLVEVDAVPPDAEARKAFTEFMKWPGVAHFSVTHEGSGFKAASVRAIVMGVTALSRPSFPHAVHNSVSEAANWAASQNRNIGAVSDARAIERAVQSLRRLHQQDYPPVP